MYGYLARLGFNFKTRLLDIIYLYLFLVSKSVCKSSWLGLLVVY